MVGVLPTRIVKSNVSSVSPSAFVEGNRNIFLLLSDERPTFETFNITIRIDSSPILSYLAINESRSQNNLIYIWLLLSLKYADYIFVLCDMFM